MLKCNGVQAGWKHVFGCGGSWLSRGRGVRSLVRWRGGCWGCLVLRGNISKAWRKSCQINFSPFQSHPWEFLTHLTPADWPPRLDEDLVSFPLPHCTVKKHCTLAPARVHSSKPLHRTSPPPLLSRWPIQTHLLPPIASSTSLLLLVWKSEKPLNKLFQKLWKGGVLLAQLCYLSDKKKNYIIFYYIQYI